MIRTCVIRALTWAACLCAVTVAGCQRIPYELAPVRVTVTIDGRPVSQVKIMFAPVENADNANPGKPAFGLLQDDGTYTLTTYESDDGAVVGEHWVTLVNLARRAQAAQAKGDRRSFDVARFTRISLPRRVTVVLGKENQIDITLTRQEVAQFGVVEVE